MPTAQLQSQRYLWSTDMDNHDPVRETLSGRLGMLAHPVTGTPTVILPGERFSPRDVFLLDDGETIGVWYVAGWGGIGLPDGAFVLNPIPVNPDGATRPDGRVIDYSSWRLGPRTMRHLKITPAGFDTDTDTDTGG